MSIRTPNDIPSTTEKRGDVTVTTLHPGRLVFCDDCGKDYTDSNERGGILFGSKAICPECAPKWERNALKYGETHFIRANCPEDQSFADWCRTTLRGDKAAA